MPIIIYLLAVALSMDAFSLSLAYGTINIKSDKILKLSLIVGIYHFIMPILGQITGIYITNIIPLKSNIIVSVLLIIIGIEMLIETFKKEEIHSLTTIEMLIFGLVVSIDSFTIGIGISQITTNLILTSLTFSLTSFLFTLLGLTLGKILTTKIGKTATFLGSIIIIIIGITYLL